MTAENTPAPTHRVRLLAYSAVLVAVGAWTCFHNLDRGMLIDDESIFAISADAMRESGDWVVLSIGEASPHLNATPLYTWLCCLTADRFPDAARYRAWSAVFAVLCALAVLLLGAELFRPEVGLLAGLLMLTNQHFLFQHAARSGVMEPGLMLFLVLMTYCYARTARPGANAAMWWGAVGGCLGLAVLMKPPAFGGFFFGLIGLHHLFARRDLPLKARFTRPLLALAVATLVALPWYALVFYRVGPESLQRLFIFNSVGRASRHPRGITQPYWLYLDFLLNSSRAAKVFWPAVGVGAACAAAGWLRLSWGLPALLAGAFTAAISASVTKNPHYAYFAFPFLCLLAAAVLLAGLLPRPRALGTGRFAVWGWRALAAAGVTAAVLLVRADVRSTRQALRAPAWEYPPLRAYRAAEPELAAGRGRVVLYRYPDPGERIDRRLGFDWVDRLYRPRLDRAERVNAPAELERLLADGTPTVVFFPPKLPPGELARLWFTTRPDRLTRLRTERMYYPVMTFHGAEARFDLSGFFRKAEVPANEPGRF